MSRIQDLLIGKYDQINYEEIIKKHPWIIEKGKYCVLSPDSDGLLCGLFLSHFLDWHIKGFYDGKVMLLESPLSARECIFLDVEIFRKDIRSIGHHMVQYNKYKKPLNWSNFENCIQLNNLRDYDVYRDFRLKYPLATIHTLIGIIGSQLEIHIPETAICPLLFTDGTFNVLFSYPENVLNWLSYLRADETKSALKSIFENDKYSVFSLMKAMDNFFRERDTINVAKERGDRLRISATNGNPYNIVEHESLVNIKPDAKDRIVRFINILADLTNWKYKEESWSWSSLKLYKYTKSSSEKDGLRLNNVNFNNLLLQNPLSWAITSRDNIEYTLETPDKLV